MKNIKYNIQTLTLFLICIVTLSGCSDDYFDTQPDNQLSVEAVFQNRNQTERWWAGLFTQIPDIWDMPYSYTYSFMTDELDASQWTNPAINSGALSPGNTPVDHSSIYESIRLIAIFLENIDNNTEILSLEGGADIIKTYKGEATFLRAYYYWILMRQVGPVVIMPLESQSPDADFQIARSTWDECVAFVLDQLAEAKVNLPVDFYQTGTTIVDGTQVGRINKMIVEAVESQVLLYHASPLYNGNNTMTDFKNLDGTELLNTTFDASRWADAATAAKEAIDIAEANGKALYQETDSDPFMAAYKSVRNMFWDGWETEGVWIDSNSDANYPYEAHTSPRAISGTAYNGIAVVQRLVDDFRMENGDAIENSSEYSETNYAPSTTTLYSAGTNSMYINREARFYANVNFNGTTTPGAYKAGQPYVEFFNTGNSGKAGAPRDWPKTGYTSRKNVHPTYSLNPGVNVERPGMLIRLAELYLNYAEALNESDPGNADVLKYLNRVRNRAGLPSLTTTSQGVLREQIRLERRIELCFEGAHRFNDVRRWMIADDADSNQGGEFYGMNMDEGNTLSSPEFHSRTLAFSRSAWQRRYYFLPFQQREMDRNKELVQFPGY